MKQGSREQMQLVWVISATQMQPASLGWLFPVHCNIEFMWDEPERLNWWQIFKERDVKVPPRKKITLTHWFERSFLTLHRLSTIQDDSNICQCCRFCDRWLSSLVFLVWGHLWKPSYGTMDSLFCLCSIQVWSQTTHLGSTEELRLNCSKGDEWKTELHICT